MKPRMVLAMCTMALALLIGMSGCGAGMTDGATTTAGAARSDAGLSTHSQGERPEDTTTATTTGR
jgi:hypothetical protein